MIFIIYIYIPLVFRDVSKQSNNKDINNGALMCTDTPQKNNNHTDRQMD